MNEEEEKKIDETTLESFIEKLREKLAKSRAKGRYGWHDSSVCSENSLIRLLHEHVDRGDPLDVALFAMFLWARNAKTISPELKCLSLSRLEEVVHWRQTVKEMEKELASANQQIERLLEAKKNLDKEISQGGPKC